MKQFLFFLSSLLFLHGPLDAQTPLLRGRVKHLNGTLVKFTTVRLIEPKVDATTDEFGVFERRLPLGWAVGKLVTLAMRLEGYDILRPWDGEIIVRPASDEQLEEIVIAKLNLVNLVKNTAELERVLQPIFEGRIGETRVGGQEAVSEFEVLRQNAQSLNLSMQELVALLNEWKTRAEARGTLYEKALAALYEKKYGDAIKLLTTDIAADEREITRSDSLRALLPRKYLNLGIAHAGKYEHAEAEQAYKKSLALKSDLSAARILLGDTYEFTGRLAEALEMYRMEARRLYGIEDSTQKVLYSGVLERIGNVYQTQGKLDSALVYCRQVLEINRRLQRPVGIASVLVNIGAVYQTQRKLDSALVYHRKALMINGPLQRPVGVAEALGNIGIVCMIRGQVDSALIYHQQALLINRRLQRPQGLAIQLGRIGNFYGKQWQLDSALVYYRQSLAIDHRLQRLEGIASTLGNLGNVYRKRGQLDSALVYYRQSLAIERYLQRPDGMASNFGSIGIVFKTQGKLDSALVYYRQALEIDRHLQRPEGMGIKFFNIGILYENRAEFGMAAAHFDSAYSLFSVIGSPYARNAREAFLRVKDPFSLGHLYLSNDKPAEALTAYREALHSNPDSLQGYLFIANLFSQTGPPDSVAAYYRHALAKNPNHAEALNNLAWHYALRNQNLEEAIALSQRSLKLKPQEPYYWDSLAEIYYRLARFTEAKNANDEARKYAKDKNVIKSIEERTQKIEKKLKEEPE
jgi:tetratricopeptide (TPR) repeat protein